MSTPLFKQLDAVPNFPALEKEVLAYWQKLGPVERLKELQKDAPQKVYYDGPITSNGMPHYGHAITWTLKDVVPRFWTMQGYYVSRNMGWDCQGLPVEVEVEKELGFEKKDDIENFGVAKFNQLCRESVLRHRDSVFEYEGRLGRWFDEKDMYYTMDRDYIESMWWALKELYTKGLLYEGYKVVAYSTRAGCPLSTHEVTDGGYKEIEDPAVTLKFKLLSGKYAGAYVLAWTTTPWTLPGNLMLAVGEKVAYGLYEVIGERYILAKDCSEKVFEAKEAVFVEDVAVKELVEMAYAPLFDYYEHKRSEGCFKIITSNHVNTEEGTGVVHLAPYGAEDFELFMVLGIKLFDYLDETANFISEISAYEGLFYKDANPKIIKDLQESGLLFAHEPYVHRMPICWRTGTPLIYKPVKSWYIAVTQLKERMLAENQRVNWLPSHLKDGMSHNWISGAYDWAISRQRYWGTPLPVWINDKTGEKVVIGSYEELKSLSGVLLDDPHKPFVDDVTWDDKENGGTFRRIPDVIDVWFDSGCVPFAKLHYPFENQDLLEKTVPAEYISEGMDQVRLWFYTMHVLGVALFDKVPYQNVVTTGMLLDKDAKKLSKSKKNFEPLDSVLDNFGGDILRYFILNSPLISGESARFYNEVLLDARKEFFIPLWNCAKYFTTYANLHNFKPTLEVSNSTNSLDQWILARLQETTNSMHEKMTDYHIMEAAREMQPFVSDLSTWYIRRSRDRIKDGDQEALATLHYVLSQFVQLIAPMLPFVSEVLYQALGMRELRGLESVHFDKHPLASPLSQEQQDLITTMQTTREIVSLALSVRVDSSIKVRQPLAAVHVKFEGERRAYIEDLILDEVNVKAVLTEPPLEEAAPSAQSNSLRVFLDITLTHELILEGRAREFIRSVQDLRKKQGFNVEDKIKVTYSKNTENDELIAIYANLIKEKVSAVELAEGQELTICGIV